MDFFGTFVADLDPIEGWYAPRFGTRVPANTLVGRGIAIDDPPCHPAGVTLKDQTTDLRSTVGTLRRHRIVLAAAALVGSGGRCCIRDGCATPLTSTTLVLLPTPALAETSSSDIDTQVRIAHSATILNQAGDCDAAASAEAHS
jgi:hypothetical protein